MQDGLPMAQVPRHKRGVLPQLRPATATSRHQRHSRLAAFPAEVNRSNVARSSGSRTTRYSSPPSRGPCTQGIHRTTRPRDRAEVTGQSTLDGAGAAADPQATVPQDDRHCGGTRLMVEGRHGRRAVESGGWIGPRPPGWPLRRQSRGGSASGVRGRPAGRQAPRALRARRLPTQPTTDDEPVGEKRQASTLGDRRTPSIATRGIYQIGTKGTTGSNSLFRAVNATTGRRAGAAHTPCPWVAAGPPGSGRRSRPGPVVDPGADQGGRPR